jgi:hypothetical protein
VKEILKEYGNIVQNLSYSLCFKDKDLVTYGSDTKLNSIVVARLSRCFSNVDGCTSDAVMRNMLNKSFFRTLVVNKYYDFTDIENPLKTYVDDSIYEKLDIDLFKRRHLLIRENRVYSTTVFGHGQVLKSTSFIQFRKLKTQSRLQLTRTQKFWFSMRFRWIAKLTSTKDEYTLC